ncbi:MAG: S-layer homology domain-containing protein [Acidobacteria bacterium]|nr:S-layer homology domain-containing protein [Acidobacteriota bacterium]
MSPQSVEANGGVYSITVQDAVPGTVTPTATALTTIPIVTFTITRVGDSQYSGYVLGRCGGTRLDFPSGWIFAEHGIKVRTDSNGRQSVYLEYFNSHIWGNVLGVSASLTDSTLLFDDSTPMPATVLIPIYMSRGTFTVSPSPLNASITAGTAKVFPVTMNSTISGASFSTFSTTTYGLAATDFLTVKTGPKSPGTGYVSILPNTSPTTTQVTARFRSPGMPDYYVPVDLTVTNDPVPLTITPSNLIFTYVKGSPEPLAKSVTITGPTANLRFDLFDSSWIYPTPRVFWLAEGVPSQFAIAPTMSNKSLGAHTTSLQIMTDYGKIGEVPVSLYVLDSPGQINATAQPPGGGTIEYVRNPENGTYTTLAARSAPGFAFARWSGSVTSNDNPTSTLVLGNMNIVAEFTPVNTNCTYTLSPARVLAPAAGDVGRVSVQTQTGCPWTFTQLPTWMTLIGSASGSGAGAISYTIAANTNSPTRQATLLGGGATVLVEQAGSGCVTISASSPGPFSATGGTQTITLSNSANCSFTPVPTDPWLTVTSPNPVQGNPYVNATATANTGNLARATSVYLGGFRLPLLQLGAQFSTIFGDINANTPFADYINILEKSGIADPCGSGFCPESPTTRAQMAEYLVHALFRSGEFANSGTPYFTDVPTTHPRFRWIQKLYELGVTTGCGSGKFCPDDSVTRGQMATFLVRARAGINSTASFPFRSTPYFTDVPGTHGFFSYVQKLRDWGITAGCSTTQFCPDSIVSRGQMTVFIVRGFLTQ